MSAIAGQSVVTGVRWEAQDHQSGKLRCGPEHGDSQVSSFGSQFQWLETERAPGSRSLLRPKFVLARRSSSEAAKSQRAKPAGRVLTELEKPLFCGLVS